MLQNKSIKNAILSLKAGGVIAYPTESVFGLGCDPFNEEAVLKLIQLKHRSPHKGFIVVGASWEQLEPLTEPVAPAILAQVLASWPGPFTWIFPSKPNTLKLVRGAHASIALRVSAHPIVQTLCSVFGPLISTSANREGHPPARNEKMVKLIFEKTVDYIVPGKVGNQLKPTQIRDAITGEILR